MFRNTFQKGLLSLFYSVGASPLALWESKVKNGHIKVVTDDDIDSRVLEIIGVNVATTYITTPTKPKESLAIKLPFMILIVKNMRSFFSFEVQILDDNNLLRRFVVSNYQSCTRVSTFCTAMPLALSPGWNKIQFNLADITRRAYGTNFVELVRFQIHANIRLRRIYFCDCLYPEDQLPAEFRLFAPAEEKPKPPGSRKNVNKKNKTDEAIARPSTPQVDAGMEVKKAE